MSELNTQEHSEKSEIPADHHTLELIKNTLCELCKKLTLDYSEITVEPQEGRIRANIIPQEKTSLYIGYRGQNINAMQHVFKSIIWEKGIDKNLFIILDIDNYRQKNEDKLLSILAEKIERCNASGENQIMPFLEPLDRRFIHLQVSMLYPEYSTESKTDGKGKRVLYITKRQEQKELFASPL